MKTPLPSWLDFFAIPASLLYGLIVNIRNRHYDKQAAIQKVEKNGGKVNLLNKGS